MNGGNGEVHVKAFGVEADVRGRDVVLLLLGLVVSIALIVHSVLSMKEHQQMAVDLGQMKEEIRVMSFLMSLPDEEKPRYRLLPPSGIWDRMDWDKLRTRKGSM